MRAHHLYRNLLFIIFILFDFSFLYAQEKQVDLPKLTNVSGGLCVYVHGTGQDLCGVATGGSFLVHGLQKSTKEIVEARKYIEEKELTPLICVEAWEAGKEFPYKKNHITLLVVSQYIGLESTELSIQKMVEVIAPLGKGCLGGLSGAELDKVKAALKAAGVSEMEEKGSWLVFQKPWQKGMGEWTQNQSGSEGNAVGNDTYLAVPNQVQWMMGGGSVGGHRLVGGGRFFHIYPNQIVARDAASGVILWVKNKEFGGALLVGENVLVPIKENKVSKKKQALLSGATGEIIRIIDYQGSPYAYANDVVVLQGWNSHSAYEASSGKLLWELKYKKGGDDAIDANDDLRGGRGNVPHFGLLMSKKYAIARRNSGEIFSLEPKTGKVIWQKNLKDELGNPFTMHFIFGDKVLVRTEKKLKYICEAGNNMQPPGPLNQVHVTFVALSLKDGNILWKYDFITLMKGAYKGQVYHAANKIWVGRQEKLMPDDIEPLENAEANFKKFNDYINEPNPLVFDGLNLESGKIEKTVTLPKQINFHCYQLTVTDRYHTGNRPYYFVSWETGEIEGRFGVVRAPCDGVGHFAAQGLFFAQGKTGCGCIRTAMTAYGAFSASEDGSWDGAVAKPAHPIEKGSAEVPSAEKNSDTDWPMLRADYGRSSSNQAKLADTLTQKWHFQVKRNKSWLDSQHIKDWEFSPFLSRNITSQPTIAKGVAYVSHLENKSVIALELKTGSVKWKKQFSARIDAPPSIYDGVALIGCSDGWVYALRCDNGEQIYRLRIAPAERRIVAYGQVESSWPIVGGVLLVGDKAYALAGRSTEIDGGLYVVCFDPLTGKVNWEGRRYLDNPGNIGGADHKRMETSGTGSADILTSDGKLIAIGDRIKGRSCFDINSGENGGRYLTVPYSNPMQSDKERSVLSVLDKKVFTAVSPKYNKAKGEQVMANPGSLLQKGKWKLDTGDSSVEAIAAGVDRLAVAVKKADKNELWIVSASDGKKIAEYPLPSAPIEDGLAISEEAVVITLVDGGVVCFGK